MKLPNALAAEVAPEKLALYLLSPGHPRGGAKARFLSTFGFQMDDVRSLEAALLAHASACDVVDIRPTDFGANYSLEGRLSSPDRRNPTVRTVWSITSDPIPRFVTLRPA